MIEQFPELIKEEANKLGRYSLLIPMFLAILRVK